MSWLAVLSLFAAFAMAWYPCCGVCDYCDGPVADQYLITFTGVVDNPCGSCDSYWNNPAGFILSPDLPGACGFKFEGSGDGCGGSSYTRVTMQFTNSGGSDFEVLVTVWSNTSMFHYAVFRKVYTGTQPNCKFDGDPEALDPAFWTYGVCDFSAATCTIEAL